MMKKFFLVATTICMYVFTVAQNAVLKVDGADRPAHKKEISEKAEDVIDALDWYFQSNGSKMKRKSGIYTVSGTILTEVVKDKLDLFFTITPAGKKRDKLSNVIIAIQNTDKSFVGEGNHEAIKNNIHLFLDKIPQIVKDYQHKIEEERLKKEAEKAQKEKEKAEKEAAKQAQKAEEAKKKLEEHKGS